MLGPKPQFGNPCIRKCTASHLASSVCSCTIIVGSWLHNGSIQAFLKRWLGKRERLSALSLATYSPCVSLSPTLSYLLLVCFAEWSWWIAELCLNLVLSYLAHPPHSIYHKDAREHLSFSLRPEPEPMYHAGTWNRIQWNGHADSYCLFALFMSMYRLQKMAL